MLGLLLALALAADPTFEQIAASVREGHEAEAIAQMERWIAAHPQEPNAGRGLVWIAQLHLSANRPELARPLLERAAHDYRGTEWQRAAQLKLADFAMLDRRYGEAIDLYGELAGSGLEFYVYLGESGLLHAREERTRYYGLIAAACGLAAVFVLRLRRGGLRPLPEELFYALPLALLIAAASLAQPHDEARAVRTLALLAPLMVWANAAYFRRSPPQRWGYLREGVLALAQAAAVFYCAVVGNGLWGKLVETMLSGAE